MDVYSLANDTHYVVTSGQGPRERIVFGWTLPLTQRAANGYKRANGGRVIKRTTARKAGLI